MLEQVGLKVDPGTGLRRLIVAEKQLVEIAKALARKARLLIMDEPTATLTPGETERLFGLIKQLNDRGVTIVYISHKLDEVERITDEVLVMRDGRFVTRDATSNLTTHQMANLMVGREISDLFPHKGEAKDQKQGPLLRVRGLTVPGWAQDGLRCVSWRNPGLCGSCRRRPDRAVRGSAGIARAPGRAYRIGRPQRRNSQPAEAADHGLTYLSEDRKAKDCMLPSACGKISPS